MSEPSSVTPPELAFGLRWGIKGSFVEYVRRMPDGKGWVGDGAVPISEHEILYAPERAGWRPTTEGDGERFWAFRGDVRFSGHAGMLFVRVAAPVLTVRGVAAELTVAAPSDADRAERIPLVTLHLEQQPAPEGVELWQGTEVRLTKAGTELFDDVYPSGESFEPLTVTMPVLDGNG
jgi:hypothetical protein